MVAARRRRQVGGGRLTPCAIAAAASLLLLLPAIADAKTSQVRVTLKTPSVGDMTVAKVVLERLGGAAASGAPRIAVPRKKRLSPSLTLLGGIKKKRGKFVANFVLLNSRAGTARASAEAEPVPLPILIVGYLRKKGEMQAPNVIELPRSRRIAQGMCAAPYIVGTQPLLGSGIEGFRPRRVAQFARAEACDRPYPEQDRFRAAIGTTSGGATGGPSCNGSFASNPPLLSSRFSCSQAFDHFEIHFDRKPSSWQSSSPSTFCYVGTVTGPSTGGVTKGMVTCTIKGGATGSADVAVGFDGGPTCADAASARLFTGLMAMPAENHGPFTIIVPPGC